MAILSTGFEIIILLVVLCAGRVRAYNAGMRLSTYLKKMKLTQGEFAAVLGTTPGLVSHWVQGRHRVPPERAADIERMTEGKVTRMDLRPDVFGPLRKWRRGSLT